MDIEGGDASGRQSGGGNSGWQTGPVGEDGADGFIGELGMDTAVPIRHAGEALEALQLVLLTALVQRRHHFMPNGLPLKSQAMMPQQHTRLFH